MEDIQLYIIDPFEKEVYASSKKTKEEDCLYHLEEYDEDMLTLKYNDITEKLEKKFDSFFRSLETGAEYDVKKYTEEPDYKNRE